MSDKLQFVVRAKFARYPEVEEVLWRTVQKAFLGEIEIDEALESMTTQICQIVQQPVESTLTNCIAT